MTRPSNAGTAAAPAGAPARDVEVVCLGESMVTFLPRAPGPLSGVPAFDRAIGGAESNVACALARAGHPARWVSRVGTDGFGDHLLAAVADCGVDTTHVQRDPLRPTGIYFRTAGERATGLEPESAERAEVLYYRAGSAASAMAPDLLDPAALHPARILHLSGITAALSDGCLGVLRALTRRTPDRPLVSFDVNYRADLWRACAHGPDLLLDLARGCDLVFVGEDEAEAAWGLHGPGAVRAALPEPATLVVKHGAAGATAFDRQADGTDTVTFAPALHVEVVAPIGAGDAFAAGYLSGTLRALPSFARLRHGHLLAAASLTVPGDLGPPLGRALADRLAALGPADWGTLRLGPGWTAAGAHRTGGGTGTVNESGTADPPATGRRDTTEGHAPAGGRDSEARA
ncbi:sugar kinase [Streptomyces kronopolitis]|uniref:sugar kinase n=1 Tax=Streptomyces kronopolitis TaxID=1612435 RepID=UPI003417185C